MICALSCTDFAQLSLIASSAWVQRFRTQLTTNQLFSALFRQECIPPPSSDGLIEVLRDVPMKPCSIPGDAILLRGIEGLAKEIKREADEIAALTEAMIADYTARFHSSVLKFFQLVQMSPLAFGFAADYSFAPLRAKAEKLCPKYASPITPCKHTCTHARSVGSKCGI